MSQFDRARIRRLLRQLPPHDNDPRYCSHVTRASGGTGSSHDDVTGGTGNDDVVGRGVVGGKTAGGSGRAMSVRVSGGGRGIGTGNDVTTSLAGP